MRKSMIIFISIFIVFIVIYLIIFKLSLLSYIIAGTCLPINILFLFLWIKKKDFMKK